MVKEEHRREEEEELEEERDRVEELATTLLSKADDETTVTLKPMAFKQVSQIFYQTSKSSMIGHSTEQMTTSSTHNNRNIKKDSLKLLEAHSLEEVRKLSQT